MLREEASGTIFWVFGMTRPGIEPGPFSEEFVTLFLNEFI